MSSKTKRDESPELEEGKHPKRTKSKTDLMGENKIKDGNKDSCKVEIDTEENEESDKTSPKKGFMSKLFSRPGSEKKKVFKKSISMFEFDEPINHKEEEEEGEDDSLKKKRKNPKERPNSPSGRKGPKPLKENRSHRKERD